MSTVPVTPPSKGGSALVIVTGWPGVGKTTLARRLGERLRVPVFTKDDAKERLFDALGVGDRAWSKRLGRAAVEMLHYELETTLAAGTSVIGECNWDAGLGSSELRAVVDRTGAIPIVVAVQADAAVVIDRYRRRARERHPGHLDLEMVEEIAARVQGPYDPPDLGGVAITVDLTDFSGFDAAVDAVAQAFEVAAPHSS